MDHGPRHLAVHQLAPPGRGVGKRTATGSGKRTATGSGKRTATGSNAQLAPIEAAESANEPEGRDSVSRTNVTTSPGKTQQRDRETERRNSL